MKEVTVYEAWNGKTFNSKEDCENYELDNRPTHTYFVKMKISGFAYAKIEAFDEEHAKEVATNANYYMRYEITDFLVSREGFPKSSGS